VWEKRVLKKISAKPQSCAFYLPQLKKKPRPKGIKNKVEREGIKVRVKTS